jgi:hypothetical protein
MNSTRWQCEQVMVAASTSLSPASPGTCALPSFAASSSVSPGALRLSISRIAFVASLRAHHVLPLVFAEEEPPTLNP